MSSRMRTFALLLLAACAHAPVATVAPTPPTTGVITVAHPVARRDGTAGTGALSANVLDAETLAPLQLATFVLTSPVLQGQASEFSDEQGRLAFRDLLPGRYDLLVVYGDGKTQRRDVEVRAGEVTRVTATVPTRYAIVWIGHCPGPAIDHSTLTGRRITQDMLRHIPWGGRDATAFGGEGAGTPEGR